MSLIEQPCFIGILKVEFCADDEVAARIILNYVEEAAAEQLDDDATIEVTQVLPNGSPALSPQEMVEQFRRTRDLLILTKKMPCFDVARELDKLAWIYEHRDEDSFNLANYNAGSFMDRSAELLGKKPR